MTEQHCPRCESREWFPGAACWHCGWEAPACPGCGDLVGDEREYTDTNGTFTRYETGADMSPETNPAESILAFIEWLTSRSDEVTFSDHHDAAVVADLVEQFRFSQGWDAPRDNWRKLLKSYPIEADQ